MGSTLRQRAQYVRLSVAEAQYGNLPLGEVTPSPPSSVPPALSVLSIIFFAENATMQYKENNVFTI